MAAPLPSPASQEPGIWFVYRSHDDGPLSRRVRRLGAPSVLAWFQAKFAEARAAAEPREVGEAELGGYVYGLGTIFEAVKQHGLPMPRSKKALKALLDEHLYVEGGPEHIRLDDHSLRVRTDDDEVELAYFFFDDEAVRRYPHRLAWLLHAAPELPEGEADAPFSPPAELPELLPGGNGPGATYACLFTFYDGETLPGKARVFPGVRLPELAEHLRRVVPASKPKSWSAEWLDTWPVELRLLRAMVDATDPSESALAPALLRCAAFPVSAVMNRGNHSRLGVGPHAAARSEFDRGAEGGKTGGDLSKSIVHVGRHAALLCAHTSSSFGHQQWVIFDDRWAAAHTELATSIIHYARGWDPFAARKAPARSPEQVAAARQEAAWKKAQAAAATKEPRAYRPAERFSVGDVVDHQKFGRGVVQRVEATKIEVLFQDGARLLAHGAGG